MFAGSLSSIIVSAKVWLCESAVHQGPTPQPATIEILKYLCSSVLILKRKHVWRV